MQKLISIFKLLFILLAMAMTTITLVSCDEDEEIATTLWGVWEGKTGIVYDYGDRWYESARTIIAFDKDPDYYAYGTGYWIDYFSHAPYDYYAE